MNHFAWLERHWWSSTGTFQPTGLGEGGSCYSYFHLNMWCYYVSLALHSFCSWMLIVGLVLGPVPGSHPVDCVKSSIMQETLQSLEGRMSQKASWHQSSGWHWQICDGDISPKCVKVQCWPKQIRSFCETHLGLITVKLVWTVMTIITFYFYHWTDRTCWLEMSDISEMSPRRTDWISWYLVSGSQIINGHLPGWKKQASHCFSF